MGEDEKTVVLKECRDVVVVKRRKEEEKAGAGRGGLGYLCFLEGARFLEASER